MDIAAQVASLANDYGATKGPNAAAAFDLELWIGDPRGSGVEVPTSTDVEDDDGVVTPTANGYASVSVTNNGTNFPPADAEGVLTTPPFTFPQSLAEYPAAVTHWVLRDQATSAVWQVGELAVDQRLTVAEAGVTPRLSLAIFYNPLGA